MERKKSRKPQSQSQSQQHESIAVLVKESRAFATLTRSEVRPTSVFASSCQTPSQATSAGAHSAIRQAALAHALSASIVALWHSGTLGTWGLRMVMGGVTLSKWTAFRCCWWCNKGVLRASG